MKYLILSLLFMCGCATVSDYNQGCRDGLDGAAVQLTQRNIKVDVGGRDRYCNHLEELRNKKKHREPREKP